MNAPFFPSAHGPAADAPPAHIWASTLSTSPPHFSGFSKLRHGTEGHEVEEIEGDRFSPLRLLFSFMRRIGPRSLSFRTHRRFPRETEEIPMTNFTRFLAAAAAIGGSRLPPPRNIIRSRPIPSSLSAAVPAALSGPAGLRLRPAANQGYAGTRSPTSSIAARQPLQRDRPPGGSPVRQRGDDPGDAQ